MIREVKKEFKKTPVFYSMLAILVILAFYIRVYRVDQILGFYFDQGRDAQVIWDLIHNHKLFLIGPTTGIAGIFRGPFYYYLIAPFYWLGNGNPVWPSVFLAATSVTALSVLYYLGVKMANRATGVLAVIFGGFSFYIVQASRWLSNPTPMLLLSTFLMLAMIFVIEGKKWAWIAISFLLGISLFHFGSSGELFYFPAVLLFGIFQWRNRPTIKIFLFCLIAFLITVAPLILFDIKHDNILSNNIRKFALEEGSFKMTTEFIIKIRTELYYDAFTNKIFPSRGPTEILFLRIAAILGLILSVKILKNKKTIVPVLLLISPIVGLLFFHGNATVVYDYYLTGFYLVFILILALVLGAVWQYRIGKIFVVYFVALFLIHNLNIVHGSINDTGTGPESISFKAQKQALDWVYNDANGTPFSVDVYVPPVIPHAYIYLFNWYGGEIKGYTPSSEQIDPLYTIYEVDPPHPERLKAWMDRQAGIGKVLEEHSFGGITVQKRARIRS